MKKMLIIVSLIAACLSFSSNKSYAARNERESFTRGQDEISIMLTMDSYETILQSNIGIITDLRLMLNGTKNEGNKKKVAEINRNIDYLLTLNAKGKRMLSEARAAKNKKEKLLKLKQIEAQFNQSDRIAKKILSDIISQGKTKTNKGNTLDV